MAGHMALTVKYMKLLQELGPGRFDKIPVGNSNAVKIPVVINEPRALNDSLIKTESKQAICVSPDLVGHDHQIELVEWNDPLNTEYMFPRETVENNSSHLERVMNSDSTLKIGLSREFKQFQDSIYTYPLIVPKPLGENYTSTLETVPKGPGSPKVAPLCNFKTCSLDYESLQFD